MYSYTRLLHASIYPLKFPHHHVLDEFIAAAQRCARAYQQQTPEKKKKRHKAEQLGFSIRQIVDERGPDSEVYSIPSARHRQISRQLGYFDWQP
jgi:hypothetical protein